ncbi:MAG TPA: hypothetical protein VM686_36105, partial [Polyangiaceae bacterium]|nr:hypothetical protein [Polyangiaceae bacterium]
MRRIGSWLALVLSACSAGQTPPERAPAPVATAASSTVTPRSEPAPVATRAVVLVTEPEALGVVEQGPGAFGKLIGPAAYQVIASTLGADLERVQRADKSSGTSLARHFHRLLDRRWLDAESARFELVAVSNRLDRQPFVESSCGEVRLVYRLRYEKELRGQALSSRLPVAISVELLSEPAEQGSCQNAARRWIVPAALGGRALGQWLIGSDGPLAPARVTVSRIARVNVNTQSVRWPST